MTTSPPPPTPSETPPARTASPDQSAHVGRTLITASLAWGTLGLAIPFGSSGGAANLNITPLEIGITILAALSFIGLVLDMLHPWRGPLWRIGFVEMAVGFVWSAASMYELIQPGEATWEWRVGHSLIYGGYAVLSLTTWRWINKGNTRGRA